MPEPPRFFFFDLGNVLLNFDHELGFVAIQQRFGVAPADSRRVLFEERLQQRYERGEVSCQEFCDTFFERTQTEGDPASLLQACSDIFRPNLPVLPVLMQLHSGGHSLGILSNTCHAHWMFVSQGRYRFLELFFSQRVLSYEACATKPDPLIYRVAQQAARASAQEIFFVDDRPENVEGACAAGLDAVLFTTVPRLIADLHRRGVRWNL